MQEPQRDAHPAVGDAQVGLGHLQHGHAESLPEGHVGQFHLAPLAGGPEQPGRLAGQGQPHRPAEAEGLKVPAVFLRPHGQPDLGRPDVAGVADDLVHGQVLVLVRVLDAASLDAPLAVLAIVLGGGLADLFLQRRRDHDGLHGRPGLEDVHGDAVLPFAADLLHRVGVEKRIVHPGQDIARGHVDHQGHAGLAPGPGHAAGQGVLGGQLHLAVDGQPQVLAVEGSPVLPFDRGQAVAGGVALDRVLGRGRGEVVVEGLLQPLDALAVHVHETEQLPGHVPLRVLAGILGLEIHAGQGLLADRRGLRVADLPGHPHEALLGLELSGHVAGVQAENLAQALGHRPDVADFVRPHVDRRAGYGLGQQQPVAVENLAALAGHRFRGPVLPIRHLGVLRPLDHLHVISTRPEPHEGRSEKNPGEDYLAAAPVSGWFVSCLGHDCLAYSCKVRIWSRCGGRSPAPSALTRSVGGASRY
ncbi:hypothetical protein DSECCO2_429740 [anaerobic digester metagenome]